MDPEVIVIGGGPAGAAAATLTALHGHSTMLLERDAQPQFKIGESLMPGTYDTFSRLGVLERLKQSPFVRKYSVQFFGKTGRASAPFYFQENDPHERSVTWQVLRSEFDQLLLDNASEKGVEVARGVAVRDILTEDRRVCGVKARLADGSLSEIPCRVLVDATGQSSLLQRKLGLRFWEKDLRKAALFSHFVNARRDPGIDEGATLVMHTRDADSWFWYIPLHENRVSVGVVGDLDYLIKSRGNDLEKTFQEELEKCPAMGERLKDARQAFPIKGTKEFSYRSGQVAGDGWVMVGDAFGFLDPIYSSGVYLALKSGEEAADAIHRALEANDPSAERLSDFGADFVEAMNAIRKLVYAFYTKDFSFARFLRSFPEHRHALVDLLTGNIYQRDFNGFFEDLGGMCPLPPEERTAPLDTPLARGA